MRYLSCLVFLFILYFQHVTSCKNFLVQYCTDIPIGFKSISTIKCIQLIPAQFDSSIDYSVENYIVEKSVPCYHIVSFDSPSITLFSNECQEICPDEYCQLFDNQLNTSIINVFYSSSSNYDYITSLTYDMSSYDYLLFDQCSSANRTNEILLIVVYILCAIVVILTIAVISKFLIARYLRKRQHERPYNPYDLYWILDCICCQIQRQDKQSNEPRDYSNNSDSMENNQIQGRNIIISSTPIQIHINGSSNTTNNQISSSSNNSSHQYDGKSPSEENTPKAVHRNKTESTDTENDSEINNLPTESENHHQLSIRLPIIHKISNEISAALSINSNTSQYEPLESKKSPSIINFRL